MFTYQIFFIVRKYYLIVNTFMYVVIKTILLQIMRSSNFAQKCNAFAFQLLFVCIIEFMSV